MSTFNKYRVKGAYHYDWYETEDWYKWCVDRCVEFCDGLTVDVGCGDGLLLSKLPKGSMGIDNDKNALELCVANKLPVAKVDMNNHEIHVPGGFDYVASLNSVEHFNHPLGLKSLIRQARKGAIIITIDWQGGAFGEDHKHEYTLKELLETFKEFNPKGFRYKDTEWIGVEITK